MKAILHLSVAAALALAGLAAAAHPLDRDRDRPHADRGRAAAHGDAIDARQARQAMRIRQGVHSGSLTRDEAAHLWAAQRRIQQAERHARADGVVTRAERARLTRMLDRAGRAIHRQKADTDWRAGPHRSAVHPVSAGRGGRG